MTDQLLYSERKEIKLRKQAQKRKTTRRKTNKNSKKIFFFHRLLNLQIEDIQHFSTMFDNVKK